MKQKAIVYGLVVCALAGCTVSPQAEPHGAGCRATRPSPEDGATGVSPDTKLRWSVVAGGGSFEIHFGTESPPPFVGTQTQTEFDPGPLDWDTTYYWRVDVDGCGEGDLWKFTTFWYGDPNAEEMDVRLERRADESDTRLVGDRAGMMDTEHRL